MNKKCMLLVVLLSINSYLIYPQTQYLNSEDFIVLRKNYDLIDNAFGDYLRKNNEYRNSLQHFLNVYALFLGNNMIENEYFILEQLYLDLMNYNIPNGLEDIFISIGWDNNGYQKYLTIISGRMYIIYRKYWSYNEDIYNEDILDNIHSILFNIFHKDDFDLVYVYLN